MLRSDILAFLKALWRHWSVLITGGVATVGLSLIPEASGAHPPPWVWKLALMATLLIAGFLAWRDEKRRADTLAAPTKAQPSSPIARVSLLSALNENDRIFQLKVSNDGAVAEFHAAVFVAGSQISQQAWWERAHSLSATIPTGNDDWVRLAVLTRDTVRQRAYLTVYGHFFHASTKASPFEQRAYFFGEDTIPILDIEVTISATPPLAEPCVRRYRLTPESLTEIPGGDNVSDPEILQREIRRGIREREVRDGYHGTLS